MKPHVCRCHCARNISTKRAAPGDGCPICQFSAGAMSPASAFRSLAVPLPSAPLSQSWRCRTRYSAQSGSSPRVARLTTELWPAALVTRRGGTTYPCRCFRTRPNARYRQTHPCPRIRQSRSAPWPTAVSLLSSFFSSLMKFCAARAMPVHVPLRSEQLQASWFPRHVDDQAPGAASARRVYADICFISIVEFPVCQEWRRHAIHVTGKIERGRKA